MTLIKHFKFSKPPLYKILLAFTLIYFIIFGILMVHTSGQPDQAPHNYFSRRYSETWGIPEENINIKFTITGQPYLYYWINGAVYKLYKFFFPNGQLQSPLLWRLMSVFYSTLTVFFTYKLAAKVTGNSFAGVLAAFFLSNTLMFVFVSGGISYDNLMNLSAVAAIYHLVNIYKKEDFIHHTTLTGIWVVIGSLAKIQFLLLTLIIFLGWLYFTLLNFRKIKYNFKKNNILLTLIFIGFLVLFIGLFGVNFLKYGRITPLCIQIKAPEICLSYDYRYEFYEPFNLQWMWFVRDDLVNPIKYAVTFWISKMLESTWGILSHNSFIPMLSVSLHGVLISWAFICFFYYLRPKDITVILLFVVLASYTAYVFLWNYKNEIEFNFQHYVLTGRYLLPTLGVLFTLMINAFLKIRSIQLKRFTIALSIILYFSGGLGIFISRYAEVFAHWRIYF